MPFEVTDPSSGTTDSVERLLALSATDADVITAVIGRAYRRLVKLADMYVRRVPRIGREREAADVLHSAYQRIYTAIEVLKPATLQALMALAANHVRWTMIDIVRAETAHRRRNLLAIEDQLARQAAFTKRDPADAMLLREVLEAIDKLPPTQQIVVDLLYFKGLSQQEAALLLDVSDRTVRRLWRAANVTLQEWTEGKRK